MVIASLILAGMLADQPRCVRWAWSGDVYQRKVWCLEWTKPYKEEDQKKKDTKKTA
jgi:hypothetical protein